MAPRSLGELLLRPTSTFARFSYSTTLSRPAQAWTPAAHRLISSSTPPSQAAQPQRKADTASAPAPRRTTTSASADTASAAIDDLFGNMSLPGTRRAPSPGFNTQQDRVRNVFGSGFSNAAAGQRNRARTLDINKLDGLPLPLDLPNQKAVAPKVPEPQEQHFPRLTPSFGRTVELNVDRGRDLVRCMSMLETLVSRNRIRADFNKQKFHERNGLKRKRLHSERWRARFKKGFKEVTSRVQELTRKGW